MIKTIRKWAKRQKQLEQSATTITISEKKKLFVIKKYLINIVLFVTLFYCFKDQVRLTTTMIALIFLYIIGEIPSYLASRRSAITLLYNVTFLRFFILFSLTN